MSPDKLFESLSKITVRLVYLVAALIVGFIVSAHLSSYLALSQDVLPSLVMQLAPLAFYVTFYITLDSTSANFKAWVKGKRSNRWQAEAVKLKVSIDKEMLKIRGYKGDSVLKDKTRELVDSMTLAQKYAVNLRNVSAESEQLERQILATKLESAAHLYVSWVVVSFSLTVGLVMFGLQYLDRMSCSIFVTLVLLVLHGRLLPTRIISEEIAEFWSRASSGIGEWLVKLRKTVRLDAAK